jgi:pyruvate kinase
MRKAKIVCTIGPASREIDVLRGMVRSGMDVARLNFSHGDAETHRENVERIRFAAEAECRPVAIQVDLQGPKFRMGEIIEAGFFVNAGDSATLTTNELIGSTIDALPAQNQNFPMLVKPRDFILTA